MSQEPSSPIEVSAQPPELEHSLWCRWRRFAVRRRTALTLLVLAPLVIFAQPTVPMYLLGLALIVAGVAIRVAASGYILKEEELAVRGPFAHTRNPLYFGSLLVTLGGWAMSGLWAALPIVLALFALVYYTVILDEEQFLSDQFGQDYVAYRRRTPRFVPRLRAPAHSWGGFRWHRVWHNKEHVNLVGVAIACLAFAARFVL